ncbi:hypothetical protein [Acinetobacter modestus]|uniref:hypothetical protein n=1 Tax=Acinetobacter modestus TaxID=1776740 RepID=UPI00301A37A9
MRPLSPKEEFALREELQMDEDDLEDENYKESHPGDSNYDGPYMNDDGDYESYDEGWYD